MKIDIRRILSIAFVTLLLVPFQNCSKASFKGRETNPEKTNQPIDGLQGNGTGYGGKVYLSNKFHNDLCSDGTRVDSRLTTVDQFTATLSRWDCVDLAPESIDLTDPDVQQHYSALNHAPYDLYVVRGTVFETKLPATPLLPTEVQYACQGTAAGNLLKAVIKVGMDNSYNIYHRGTLQVNGNEIPLPNNLARVPPLPNGKGYVASDANATFSLTTVYTDASASAMSYSSSSYNLTANLTCYMYHPGF
jgi:hypothetical protein